VTFAKCHSKYYYYYQSSYCFAVEIFQGMGQRFWKLNQKNKVTMNEQQQIITDTQWGEWCSVKLDKTSALTFSEHLL